MTPELRDVLIEYEQAIKDQKRTVFANDERLPTLMLVAELRAIKTAIYDLNNISVRVS